MPKYERVRQYSKPDSTSDTSTNSANDELKFSSLEELEKFYNEQKALLSKSSEDKKSEEVSVPKPKVEENSTAKVPEAIVANSKGRSNKVTSLPADSYREGLGSFDILVNN